jgi:hypothetical protein
MPERICSPLAPCCMKWLRARCPFVGKARESSSKPFWNATPTPAVRLNPDVPPKLEEIINKASGEGPQPALPARLRDPNRFATPEAGHESGRSAAAEVPCKRLVSRSSGRLRFLVLLVALLVAGGLYYRSHQQSKRLTDKDTIVPSDFDNKTGDPIFDDTLKTALNVSLRQSPFLSVLSDQQVAETLKLMTRPATRSSRPE